MAPTTTRHARPVSAAPAIPTTPGMAPAPLHEVSQPLQPGAGGVVYADGTSMTPGDRARANERELKPLVYEPGPLAGAPAPALDPFYQVRTGGTPLAGPASLAGPAGTASAAPVVKRLKRPSPASPASPAAASPVGIVLTDAIVGEAPSPTNGTPSAIPDAVDPATAPASATTPATSQLPLQPPSLSTLAAEDLTRMPAASDTDSPTRGIPRQILPRGKEITGGFGDARALAYFALNGQELLALLDQQLGALYDRCKDDLRFNEGLCYPQVTLRVVVEVRGFVQDGNFTVERLLPADHEACARNPIAFCREVAEEVGFVLIQQHQETTAEGQPVTAPAEVRATLGLPQPGKRRVKQGAGSAFVDM